MNLNRLEIIFCGLGWIAAGVSAGANNYTVMEIAYLALGLVGVIRMAKLIVDRDRYWSICTIVAGAMMPSYFIGGFITLAQYDPASASFFLPGGDDFLINSLAPITYISLFYWMLVGLARYEHPFWRRTLYILHSPVAWKNDETVLPVIGFGLIALTVSELYLILSGGITLGGVGSDNVRLPVGATLVIDFSDPLIAVAGWLIGRWRRPLTLARFAILTAACQAIWLGSLGRRFVLYGVVVFLSTFFWARGKRKSNRVFYVAIPVLGVLYFFTKLFVAMRYASYSYSDAGSAQSLTTLYSDAFSLLSTDADAIADAEKDNYAGRFFIFGYLMEVMNGLTLPMAQFGKFLFIAIFVSIPSVFLPGKTEMLMKYSWAADGKALINDALGLPPLDSAWTPMIAAYGDFMWLGAIIYPLLVLGLGWVFSRIVQAIRYPSLIIGSLGLCFMEFLSTETGISAYILVGRTLMIIWFISKIVEFFAGPAARR